MNGRTRVGLKNTFKGGDDDDNDDDKDNGFFGDWVEGNWCYLLSKHDNNNNNGDGADADSVDTSRQIRHRKTITTTRSRKKPRINRRINDDSTRKHKRSS